MREMWLTERFFREQIWYLPSRVVTVPLSDKSECTVRAFANDAPYSPKHVLGQLMFQFGFFFKKVIKVFVNKKKLSHFFQCSKN